MLYKSRITQKVSVIRKITNTNSKSNRPERKVTPDNLVTKLSEECRTHNERFGATAAGRADLKGST